MSVVQIQLLTVGIHINNDAGLSLPAAESNAFHIYGCIAGAS